MKEALIDTDILSYFLNGNEKLTSKTEEYLLFYSHLSFSEITYFEILVGLEYKKAKKQIEQFELFSSKSNIIKIDNNSIRASATIYGQLRRKGIQIGTPDLLIAGTAIEHNLKLITNNEKHYSRIEMLNTSNWLQS